MVSPTEKVPAPEDPVNSRNPVVLLRSDPAASGIGLCFSLWLTYLELFVIRAICMWCVGSAVVATALFVVCALDARDDARRAM